MQIKRFANNTFFTEKNPTIVNFPVKLVTSVRHFFFKLLFAFSAFSLTIITKLVDSFLSV